jgi:pantetheine-phosphate adenylyltransferase
MTIQAIYAGSFDILTHGHCDIINQSIKMFGNCNVVIGHNSGKKCMFSDDERFWFLDTFRRVNNLNEEMKITRWAGLTVDAFQFHGFKKEETVLVRGVRNMTDMIAEMALADINEEIGNIKTIFIPTSNQYRNYSSSAVKELLFHGKDVSKYCPEHVIDLMESKKCILFQ